MDCWLTRKLILQHRGCEPLGTIGVVGGAGAPRKLATMLGRALQQCHQTNLALGGFSLLTVTSSPDEHSHADFISALASEYQAMEPVPQVSELGEDVPIPLDVPSQVYCLIDAKMAMGCCDMGLERGGESCCACSDKEVGVPDECFGIKLAREPLLGMMQVCSKVLLVGGEVGGATHQAIKAAGIQMCRHKLICVPSCGGMAEEVCEWLSQDDAPAAQIAVSESCTEDEVDNIVRKLTQCNGTRETITPSSGTVDGPPEYGSRLWHLPTNDELDYYREEPQSMEWQTRVRVQSVVGSPFDGRASSLTQQFRDTIQTPVMISLDEVDEAPLPGEHMELA